MGTGDLVISDETKQQIRDAADIVAVIGQHVQLRKAGRSFKGLCPFHGEKTPSFNVSPERQSFICFGCSKKGDVFTFVMEMEGKSFIEAAEQLAQRFGVDMPKVEENPQDRRMRGERAAMLSMNKLATLFFREQLAKHEGAKAYLARRGVGDEIAEKFQLGYAPDSFNALHDHLRAKSVDLELAAQQGLLGRGQRGFYDKFKDRLVCPVIVPGGDVIAFSARLIADKVFEDGSAMPKYINSAESLLYRKGKNLFGLFQARESIQRLKRVVLVEGNFDVITLHQAGFTEVVAPLGTALTMEQVTLLKRQAERAVLLYDGDKAGYKATMHALQMCVEAEVEVAVASRPGHGKSGGSGVLADGMDPDALVAGGGSAVLREAIDRAQGGIEFFAFEVWGKARGNADARARALSDAARLVAKVATPIKRDLIVGTLATALAVDPNVVWAEVKRALHGGPPQHRSASPPQPSHVRDLPAPPPPAKASAFPVEELAMMSLMADHPDLIATPEAHKAFCLLTDDRLRDMYSRARAGDSLAELIADPTVIPPSQLELVTRQTEIKDPRRALASMIEGLEAQRTRIRHRELYKQLVASGRTNNVELSRRLAQLALALRQGDDALAEKLFAEIAELTNGKQVD